MCTGACQGLVHANNIRAALEDKRMMDMKEAAAMCLRHAAVCAGVDDEGKVVTLGMLVVRQLSMAQNSTALHSIA